MHYYTDVLKKYVVFKGRATRKEYWMFVLVNMIIGMILGIILGILGKSVNTNLKWIGNLYSLAVLLPSLAVGARRLHDTNRSAWWLLLCLVPIVGWIVLIIFYVMDSTLGDNKYGPNLKTSAVAENQNPPVAV